MEAIVLMGASFHWEKMTLWLNAHQGVLVSNLCPSQKHQGPSLYFWVSGCSCLILRNTQASPGSLLSHRQHCHDKFRLGCRQMTRLQFPSSHPFQPHQKPCIIQDGFPEPLQIQFPRPVSWTMDTASSRASQHIYHCNLGILCPRPQAGAP